MTNVVKTSPSRHEGSMSDPSSEFQILNESPTDEIGSFSHLNDLQFTISNAVFDLRPDEIQTQIRNLLKENVELKETLHQNNIAMNEQFNRLLTWRSEMTTVQQQHKQKFEETRLLVQNLRKENTELTKQLQTSGTSKQALEVLEKENSMLKERLLEMETSLETMKRENERCSIVELQMQNELKTKTDVYEQLKTRCNALLIEKQDLIAMNNELNTKIAACKSISPVRQPLDDFKEDDKENLSFVMLPNLPTTSGHTDLRKDKKSITELLLQLQVERDKNMYVTTQLIEERKKTQALNIEITEMQNKAEAAAAVVKQQSEQSLSASKESVAELKLQLTNDYFERYKEHLTSLENWPGLRTEINVGKLQSEVGTLKQSLLEQQSLNNEDKKNLIESRQQFEMLLKDYQEMLKSWEKFEKEQTNKSQQSAAYHELQIRTLNEQIDALTAKLVSVEETLTVKTDEVERMKTQGHTSIEELQKIPILQAQVEVYRSDFRAEREQGEKFRLDRDKALCENRDLKKRIRQLEDELLAIHSSPYQRTIIEQTPGRQAIYSGPVHPLRRIHASDGVDVTNDLAGLREGSATPRSKPERLTRAATVSSAMGSSSHSGNTLGRNISGTSSTCSVKAMQGNSIPHSPDDNLYFCPKCSLGFTDFQPLENHVNDCLDNDDPFIH